MLNALQEVSKVSNIHAFMESQKRHFREDNTTHPQEFRVSTILTKIQRWGKWGRERERERNKWKRWKDKLNLQYHTIVILTNPYLTDNTSGG